MCIAWLLIVFSSRTGVPFRGSLWLGCREYRQGRATRVPARDRARRFVELFVAFQGSDRLVWDLGAVCLVWAPRTNMCFIMLYCCVVASHALCVPGGLFWGEFSSYVQPSAFLFFMLAESLDSLCFPSFQVVPAWVRARESAFGSKVGMVYRQSHQSLSTLMVE